MWIADPSSPRGHPRVPEPWTSWAIHQYDISGNIDRDVANYASQQEMFDKLGKQATPTPPPEPDMTNIGGNVSAVAATVWPNGQIVVAGIGTDSFVWRRAWSVQGWGRWQKVSPTEAKGTLALIVTAAAGVGKMYYIERSGATIELTTTDFGTTWT